MGVPASRFADPMTVRSATRGGSAGPRRVATVSSLFQTERKLNVVTQQAPPPNYSSGNVPPPDSGNPPVTPAPAPAKGGGKGAIGRIVGIVVVVLVLFVGGIIWRTVTGAPSTAKVGDCVSGSVSNANETKVVDCTDAKATGKVVGKVEDKTEAEFQSNTEEICKPYPTAETAFWEGNSGKKGYVLCLAPAK